MTQQETVIQAYLVVLAELAEAKVSAVFQPRETRQELVAQVRLDQDAIDAVELAWNSKRQELEARGFIELGPSVVQRLRAPGGATVGLLYLDRTQNGYPNPPQQQIQEHMTNLLAAREPRALGPSLAKNGPEDAMREQLVLALGYCGGNKAAAARLLGCSRQTLYERINRFGLDPKKFRR